MSLRPIRSLGLATGLLGVVLLVGCASGGRTQVSFKYSVEPARRLPAGINKIAIMPAKVGPTTDKKWSKVCANSIQSLIQESRSKFGTRISVTDKSNARPTFNERDLVSKLSRRSRFRRVSSTPSEGVILSNVNVRLEDSNGKQFMRTSHKGGKKVNDQPQSNGEKQLAVQAEFKLVDGRTNKVWERYAPRTYRLDEKVNIEPMLENNKLSKFNQQEKIVARLMEKATTEFISRIMPTQIQVDANVQSSSNGNCKKGVSHLKSKNWKEALESFKLAMKENPNDHQAAYGAGIACEAMGNFNQAVSFFRHACAGANNPEYREARDRVKTFGHRARG